jgi:hypothetical protein
MIITFRGVFAESLGGFLVVRGFAKLSELAAHSFADPADQRELRARLNKRHKSPIGFS